MEGKMHGGAIKFLCQRARELRNNATHTETILWGYLKTKPFAFKFRRQHPYSIYILDFYCHPLKVVIEVDGSIHELDEIKKNAKVRQKLLENDGSTVIRFDNIQIEQNAEEEIRVIEDYLRKRKNES